MPSLDTAQKINFSEKMDIIPGLAVTILDTELSCNRHCQDHGEISPSPPLSLSVFGIIKFWRFPDVTKTGSDMFIHVSPVVIQLRIVMCNPTDAESDFPFRKRRIEKEHFV